MTEERKMILEMLKDGKISVEEAEKLLAEAGGTQESAAKKSPGSINKSFLRIRVEDGTETTVNVNIPIALAEVGLKMVPKDKLNINGNEINLDEILQLIHEGTEGELVNIDVNENGKETKVKIYID
ncbi:MAG: DUF2089 domain-containing protein [bacterium]|nr:DUF2089 domain-containing protein [bacterium]